jgi:hypothetical protein
MIDKLTPEDLIKKENSLVSKLLDKWFFHKRTGAILEAQAKFLIETGEEIENYYLTQGAESPKIHDGRKAVSQLLEYGFKPSEILSICTISHADVREMLMDKEGLSKQQADSKMDEILFNNLTRDRKAGSLKRGVPKEKQTTDP